MQKMFGGNAAVDVKSLLARGGKLIDVRTPEEYAQGHAKGAVNIPLQELQRQLPKLKRLKVPVVAYCRSGNRSGIAAQILNANGMEAYNAGSLGEVNAQLR